jgi:hypothetical protein
MANYSNLPSALHPGLVVFLVQVSASMEAHTGRGYSRLRCASLALESMVMDMFGASLKGERLRLRFRVAILAYAEQVWDVLGGIKTIVELAESGLPVFRTMGTADAATAFGVAADLVAEEIGAASPDDAIYMPVPLVVHLTDGRRCDPEPQIRRLQSLAVPDGSVLLMNVWCSDDPPCPVPVCRADNGLWDGSARKLDPELTRWSQLSSCVPRRIRCDVAARCELDLGRDSVLLFPHDASCILGAVVAPTLGGRVRSSLETAIFEQEQVTNGHPAEAGE